MHPDHCSSLTCEQSGAKFVKESQSGDEALGILRVGGF
jgi:hypothetical protein